MHPQGAGDEGTCRVSHFDRDRVPPVLGELTRTIVMQREDEEAVGRQGRRLDSDPRRQAVVGVLAVTGGRV